eukprot:scaffold431_cov334-Pavlova_lutheri.AAC.60
MQPGQSPRRANPRPRSCWTCTVSFTEVSMRSDFAPYYSGETMYTVMSSTSFVSDSPPHPGASYPHPPSNPVPA